MIPPLSSRPFHAIRSELENLKDAITSIFFDILSCFNSKWEAYAKYYDYRASVREKNTELYPDAIVNICVNRLYPGKDVRAPAPDNSHDKDYEIIAFPENKDYLVGLCAGMCIDHMNRVRRSKKPFIQTIKELGDKFSKGSSRKGFLKQYDFTHINLSDDYTTRLKKYLKDLIIKIVNEKPVDNLAPEQIDSFSESKTNNLLYLFKYADRLSFSADKNNRLRWAGELDFKKPIVNGDYLIIKEPIEEEGIPHAICVYKRDEGSVVFDPNIGTLAFETDQKLEEFLNKSSASLYPNRQVILHKFAMLEEKSS